MERGNHFVLVALVALALGVNLMITRANPRVEKRALADDMHAATLSRENYGVVLKPGRLMSTADVTHLLQGFRIKIPYQQSQDFRSLNTTQWCYVRAQSTRRTIDRQVCDRLHDTAKWLNATATALARAQAVAMKEALDAMPAEDDREWIGDNQLGGSRTGNRSSRGLPILSLIGTVSYHLFGTAKASDVEYNRGMIDTIGRVVGEMNEDMADMNERAKETIKKYTQLARDLNVLSQDMHVHANWTTNKIATHAAYLNSLVMHQTYMPMLIEDKLGIVVYYLDLLRRTLAFRTGTQALLQGRLSMELVPARALVEATDRVSKYLQEKYPRFKVAFKEPSFYYDNARPMFLKESRNTLAVYIRVPVVSEEHMFRVYQVHTFPVPIRLSGTDDRDALQIVGLPAQIAVSLSGQYYIPMPAADFGGCYGRTIILCKDIPYLKRVTENTCIAALLRNDKEIITTKCDMDYLLNPDFGEMAIYLDDGHVLVVSSETDGQLICGNRPPIQKKLEHFAKIMIGCDCAFQTRGAWIPYSLRNCGGKVLEYQVEYPNSALLEARLRVQTWTTSKMGQETLEAPLAIAEDPLPPPLRSKLKDHAEGHTYRVPMTELVGRIKDRREVLERGHQVTSQRAWHSPSNWPAFVALTLVVVVCVVIGIVACKLRSQVTAAFMAARIERASALREMPYCPPTTGPCPVPSTIAEMLSAILAVTVIILILIVVVMWMRRKKRANVLIDGLYVEFATPNHREVVFLGEIVVPHDHVFSEGTCLVTDILVNRMFLKNHIAVKWGQRVIGAASRQGEHPAVIPLPENLIVSKTLARAMMGPAKCVSMARLLRRVGGIAYPIPRDVPRLMDASWTLVGGALMGDVRPRKRQAPSPPREPLSVNIPMANIDHGPTVPEHHRMGTGAVYELT